MTACFAELKYFATKRGATKIGCTIDLACERCWIRCNFHTNCQQRGHHPIGNSDAHLLPRFGEMPLDVVGEKRRLLLMSMSSDRSIMRWESSVVQNEAPL